MSRVALVTGGTGGIGQALVSRLAIDGYRVVFTGRDQTRADELAARTGAVFVHADARDRAACDASVARALAETGRIDLLVANTGVLVRQRLEDTPDEVVTDLLETNLSCAFRYARAVFPGMREHGGGVMIMIASDTALRGSHRVPAYSVSKAALVAVAELFAAEGAPFGIRVNAICPGNTLPGMAGDEPESWRSPPNGRFATADDVAQAVAWLASAQAVHINGASVRIDGGAGAALAVVTRA